MTYLLLILATMFWGGNYIAGKLLVHRIDPIMLTEIRWLLTALLLSILYHKKVVKNLSIIRHNFFVLFLLAFLGQVSFPVTLYVGLQTTTSLNAAIYMAATPAIMILMNFIFFRENISLNKIFGVLLSTIGVLFVITKGNFNLSNTFSHINTGDIWAMVSAFSWAMYCVLLRKKSKELDGQSFVTVSAIIGSIILLPILFATHRFPTEATLDGYFHINTLLGILYLVIFPSWLAFVFWSKGMHEIGATKGGIFTHLIPLFGGTFSIIFLNTHLHFYHVISVICIACGIYICTKKQNV